MGIKVINVSMISKFIFFLILVVLKHIYKYIDAPPPKDEL